MNVNTMKMKEMNADIVRRILRDEGIGTKASLADRSGLSVASCGNILKELADRGEVRELPPGESTGGRPSRRFAYNADYAHALSMYVRKEGGSATLFTAVSSLTGRTLTEEARRVENLAPGDLEEAAARRMEETPTIRAASLAVPGVVDAGRIGICDVPALEAWDAADGLAAASGIPVVVENDMNAAAWGLCRRRDAPASGSLVYLYFPDGGPPGAGIVVNGAIVRGRNNFAGELSFLPLGPSREEQARLPRDSEAFGVFVGKTVVSAVAVLDPDTVILSGLTLPPSLLDGIEAAIRRDLPVPRPPDLRFEQDIHASLAAGLVHLALRELTCGFELTRTTT